MFDQTWTFLGEHWLMVLFRRIWNCSMLSRGVDTGSGRSKPAEKAAFAMAT